MWSALSYIHIATPAKPIVDKDLWVWTHDGSKLDLMEKCREPFTAAAWRKRREGLEVAAALEGKKEPSFHKLDLQALILSKHLHTKASLLTYVQDHGSCAAQDFVSKHQRRQSSLAALPTSPTGVPIWCCSWHDFPTERQQLFSASPRGGPPDNHPHRPI